MRPAIEARIDSVKPGWRPARFEIALAPARNKQGTITATRIQLSERREGASGKSAGREPNVGECVVVIR